METINPTMGTISATTSFNFLASLINGNWSFGPPLWEIHTAFNFLASLINGNQERQARLQSVATFSTFNFLASLINGNQSILMYPSLGMGKASFNFLASLINGNFTSSSAETEKETILLTS